MPVVGSPNGPRWRGTKAERSARDWEMYQQRVKGWTLAKIAAHHGLTEARVSQVVNKIIDARRVEMVDGMAEFVAKQRVAAIEKLDAAEAKIWEVIERRHLLVNAGQVVTVPRIDPETGDMVVTAEGADVVTALEDDGPTLAAVNGALDKIWRRRAALLGLDAPTKVETTGTYEYTVNGVDPEAMR
jgi:hypothetical protein